LSVANFTFGFGAVWAKIQRNYLPILSGLIFAFILAVVAVEIDRQAYQSKKKEICIHNWDRLCPESLTKNLFQQAERYFSLMEKMRNEDGDRSRLMPLAEDARRAMDEETSRILNSDNCLIGITVFTVEHDGDERIRERVLSREVDKFKKQNTFANSLVLRRFWGGTTWSSRSVGPSHMLIGEVSFRYTTPLRGPVFQEIRHLTSRFRLYLAGVVLTLGLLYWYILRHLIMPIKLITDNIDRSKGALPEILPYPRTVLESAYNDLARDALLNAVTRTMAEYMSVDRLASRGEIVGGIPEQIAPNFGFAAVYAVELVVGEGSESPMRWCRSAFHAPSDPEVPLPTESDWAGLGRQFARDWNQGILDFAVSDNKSARPYFAVPIAADREQRRVTLLVATPRGPLAQENLRWHRETLLRLAKAVRSGLETLDLQRDLIVREKSKAGINLSRHLGHDLTNVIATSKLELDTVRRFLGLPAERRAQLDPQRRALFDESLQGLLNNTKFLQEIVNIYRSFSYMHHPRHESVNPNALADEVVELFQLSLSRRIQIHKVYGDGVPHGYVEPRLLKLAVFNLLTNATDALKRRAVHEGDFDASLWITTTYDKDSKKITITVRDNGWGIRNEKGELATPSEIRTIFQADFSTRQEGMAEGLGLNWVRQIVGEFHQGQLHARNHPEGGAEVSLVLPHSESSPDLEGPGDASEQRSARADTQGQANEVKKS